MEFDIHKTLEWLDLYIGREAYCYFNNPTSQEKIEAFEKIAGICLPQSYKLFLMFTNGGMIVNNSLDTIIKRDKDIATAKWNANYLLSLEEMKTEWNSMKNRNFGISQKDRSIYPIIPFCKTKTNEYLVFISVFDKEIESPVFDAFHEEPLETWGLVANDFNEFLYNYLKSNGDPEVMGDETLGVATDFTGPVEYSAVQDETNQMVIERTTALIKYRPEDDWAHVERGIAYRECGNYKKALNDISKGIELAPDFAYYYFLRGDLYQRVNKIRAALIDYDVAAKLKPGDTLYLSCRATILWQMGKFETALLDADEAIAIDDRALLAYLVREEIYRSLGEDEKADSDRQKIEELKEEE